ncbi:MAG: hypothetical protein ACMXYC_01880 [Candidatus Woesearchaeota archaeon]
MKYHMPLLLGIVSLYTCIRLYMILTYAHVSEHAYFLIRDITHIQNHALPIIMDPLMHHYVANIPFVSYIVFSLTPFFSAQQSVLIAMTIGVSSIPFFIYSIALQFSSSRTIALLSGLASIAVPFFTQHMYNYNPLFVLLPFLLLLHLLTIRMIKKQQLSFFSLLFLLLCSILHPIFLLWTASVAIYFLLCYIEKKKIHPFESQFYFTHSIIVLSIILLFFIPYMRTTGIALLWQNIPLSLRLEAFSDFNLFFLIVSLGIFPFIGACYAIYHEITHQKRKEVLYAISNTAVALICLWLTLIPTSIGLLYLSISLLLLFPVCLSYLFWTVQHSKLYKFSTVILSVGIILFIISSVIPTSLFLIQQPSTKLVNYQYIGTFIDTHTPSDATLIIPPSLSQVVLHYANRPVILDNIYSINIDATNQLEKIQTIYTTQFTNAIIEYLIPYYPSYIIHDTQDTRFFSTTPYFISDNACFEPVYTQQSITVYQVTCRLTTHD